MVRLRARGRAVARFQFPIPPGEEYVYARFPYAFITSSTGDIVIRRGEAQQGFTHPDIVGQRCLPAYQCLNPKCSGIEELGEVALFPFDVDDGESSRCPYCKRFRDLEQESIDERQRYRTTRYLTPQFKQLKEEFLKWDEARMSELTEEQQQP